MTPPDPDTLIPAVKAAGATIAGAFTYLIAQVTLPDFGEIGAVGNFGLVAVLALIIGRYTFRQLEDYRSDLKAARTRNDELHTRIESLEDDLHELGKAKAAADARARTLEEYAHRLRVWAVAAGLGDEIPTPPEFPS